MLNSLEYSTYRTNSVLNVLHISTKEEVNTLGNCSRFSELVDQRGLNISEISRDTGVSRTTLTDLYYSRGNQSAKTLKRLCKYLSCDIGEIISFDEEKGEQ